MVDDDKKTGEQKKDERAKAERQALVPDDAGKVRVEAIMGPYRGQHLTMTAADGDAAINGHWARDPNVALYGHDPLSEQERTDALAASHVWAQAQWDAAQGIVPPDPPPPEGGEGEGGVTRRRAMKPDEGHGYTTRDHKS
jgi:hypothetical protein